MFNIDRIIERTNHFNETEIQNLIGYLSEDTNIIEWPSLIFVLMENGISDDAVELFIEYVLKRTKELCDIKDDINYNDLFNEFIYQFNSRINMKIDFERISINYPKSFKLLSKELYFNSPRISHHVSILIPLITHFERTVNKPQIDNIIKQLKFLRKLQISSMQYRIITDVVNVYVITLDMLDYFFNSWLKHKIPIKISTIDAIIFQKECEPIDQKFIDALYRFRAKLVLNNNGFTK